MRFRTILRILRSKGLIRQLKNLVRDILRHFKIKKLTVNCRLGLDDPADTGLIYAIAGAATPFLSLPAKYQVRVRPSFSDEAVFEGYLYGVLRLCPIKLIRPLIRFVFSLAALRVLKILVLMLLS